MVRKCWILFAFVFLMGFSAALADGPILVASNNPNAVPIAWFALTGLTNPEGLEGPEGTIGGGLCPAGEEFDFYGGFACNGQPTIGAWNDSNHVVLRYCSTTGSLNVRVDASPSYCMDARIGAAPAANYLQFELVNRVVGTSVSLRNVTLLIGNRRLILGSFETSGSNAWHVQGIDFSHGFTVEGDVILQWPAFPVTAAQATDRIVVKLGVVPGLATASLGENFSSTSTPSLAQR